MSQKLTELMQEAETLAPDEQLQLIAHLAQKLSLLPQQQAVKLQFHQTAGSMAQAREAIGRSQARYAGRTFSDSVELLREDRERLRLRINHERLSHQYFLQ